MKILHLTTRKTFWFFRHLFSNPQLAVRRLIGYFKPPLLSFQMGKVGSSTIKDTIEMDYRVHHMHTKFEMEPTLAHIRRSNSIGKIDIVTATRDPIGREISVFFQNLTAPEFPYGVSNRKMALELGAKGLIPYFKNMLESGGADTTDWFDIHFKTSTGINVYDYSFEPEKGWQIIETDDYKILVVRFEDIKRNYLDAINAFVEPRFGTPNRYQRIRPFNVSENKWYSELMKEFKINITFNKKNIDQAYSSKYSMHFYTSKEIETMKSKYQLDV
jgi:hypothetical protein